MTHMTQAAFMRTRGVQSHKYNISIISWSSGIGELLLHFYARGALFYMISPLEI